MSTVHASVAIQVLPKMDSTQEVVRVVDAVIDYIASTRLRYEVGPFETTIEGDNYETLLEIVKNCQLVAVQAGAPSVSAYVKISYQPQGAILSIDEKITKHIH